MICLLVAVFKIFEGTCIGTRFGVCCRADTWHACAGYTTRMRQPLFQQLEQERVSPRIVDAQISILW